MANFTTISREQDKQRELLELVLRNQVAIMTYIVRTRGEAETSEIRVMLKASANWLETESVTHIDV